MPRLREMMSVEYRLPPSVRREYGTFFKSDRGQRLKLQGAAERENRISKLPGPRELSPQDELLFMAVVAEGLQVLGVGSVGEIEAIAYAMVQNGHVLSSDSGDLNRAIPIARRVLRTLQPPFPDAERVRARLTQTRPDLIYSPSSIPLMIAAEAGLATRKSLLSTIDDQEAVYQALPKDLRRFAREGDSEKRKRILQALPGYGYWELALQWTGAHTGVDTGSGTGTALPAAVNAVEQDGDAPETARAVPPGGDTHPREPPTAG